MFRPEGGEQGGEEVFAGDRAGGDGEVARDGSLSARDLPAGLAVEVERLRRRLHEAGVGLGDRVGVRVPSGTNDLYVAVLGTLAAGAAYVPVDAEDPDERAALVFGEAEVAAVLGAGLSIDVRAPEAHHAARRPGVEDDAWIIFTSGSTGRPKGVAVTHRSAATACEASVSWRTA